MVFYDVACKLLQNILFFYLDNGISPSQKVLQEGGPRFEGAYLLSKANSCLGFDSIVIFHW